MDDLEYMHSIYKLSKKELRFEVMSQSEQIAELQAEIDTMKFIFADASDDLISISKAQHLVREDRKLNRQVWGDEPNRI